MSVSDTESTPKKRPRKALTEVKVATQMPSPADADYVQRMVGSLSDEVGELRASVDVLTEDVLQSIGDVSKNTALLSEGSRTAVKSVQDQVAKIAGRVEVQCERFDALLAALAICDRIPSRNFHRLMREVRVLAAKLDAKPVQKPADPMPEWQVWALWIVGSLVVALALFGVWALVRVVS